MTVLHMDCREGLQMFPDNSFDSIVTDPPYELGFMGKSWDSTGIAYNVEMWREAMRVLKPGGHLLAFSGSRTYHRMACAIEDGGFDIRDQIMWVYGSGFPKSMNVAKAITAAELGFGSNSSAIRRAAMGDFYEPSGVCGNRDGVGNRDTGLRDYTLELSEAARQWDGWGTALKPAHEPICVARKPLLGTVAANVLAHGVGALNIDGCRVEGPGGAKWETPRSGIWRSDAAATARLVQNEQGRWPANLIHDGSDEVLAAFPQAAGQLADVSNSAPSAKTSNVYGAMNRGGEANARRLDAGSAARFFYCAKASKGDRGGGNNHPTVKPTELMRYLVRLVTPPGGVVLDLFAGSGSTFKACTLEGFDFIGFELQAEYVALANARGRLTV